LICADPMISEFIRSTLRELGFKFHTAETADTAIERIRYTPYDVIVIQDTFSGTSARTNAVLGYLAPLATGQRRTSMVCLLGPGFKTLDAMQAFSQNVHLVVNTTDLPNFTAILKKSWAEFELTYKMYKTVFEAIGEK